MSGHISALGVLARDGVPGDMAVAAGFDAANEAFAARNVLAPDAPWYSRLWRWAKGLVKVRRLGAPDDSADAVAGRVESFLARGDFPAAFAEYSRLGPGSDFAAVLEAKARASSASDALFAEALSRASGEAGGAK
jgi:hypothetical protein